MPDIKVVIAARPEVGEYGRLGKRQHVGGAGYRGSILRCDRQACAAFAPFGPYAFFAAAQNLRTLRTRSRAARAVAHHFKVLNRYSVTSCSGLSCVTSAEVKLG